MAPSSTWIDLEHLVAKGVRVARRHNGVLPVDLAIELSNAGLEPDKIIELANNSNHEQENC